MKSIFSLMSLPVLCVLLPINAPAGDDKDMKQVSQTASIPDSDAGFYVAAYGGANFAQHYGSQKIAENSPDFPRDFTHGTGTDSIGAVGGAKFGYNFDSYQISGDFRLQPAVEIEAFYLGSYSKQNYPDTDDYIANDFRARYNDAALMTNGIVRFKTGTLLTPYLGIGIGAEYLSNTGVEVYAPEIPAKAGLSGDSSVVFATQFLAGVDVSIAKGWSVFTEYKYLAALAPNFNNVGTVDGGPYTAKFEPSFIGQQMITAGIKYTY
jgi:opacity protein-like surface antigen